LEYEPLRLHDPTMAGILVVSWLFISGILFINLFIGKATVTVCVFFGLRPLIYVSNVNTLLTCTTLSSNVEQHISNCQ
jgi:hypothetical protein